MKRLRLLIADVDRRHIARLEECFRSRSDMEICGVVSDGIEALAHIRRSRPDVLITDIQLPKLDGISLLKGLRNLSNPPAPIVCTRFYSDSCIQHACHHGALYFMYKPLDYESLPDIVTDCWLSREQSTARQSASAATPSDRAATARSLLRALGIPARLIGSVYLTLFLTWDSNESSLRNLSKGLYAAIADEMGTTVGSVERALRGAVDVAYRSGALSGRFAGKPTNKEFLLFLLDQMREARPPRESKRPDKFPDFSYPFIVNRPRV